MIKRNINTQLKNYNDLMKKINKKPTYREEANAIIHQCLRDGFIEELHSGKHSKLLENSELSRITQEEMKKLMIETSAKLTKFLELRDKNLKNYKKIINGITLFYTHHWNKNLQEYKIKGKNKNVGR